MKKIKITLLGFLAISAVSTIAGDGSGRLAMLEGDRDLLGEFLAEGVGDKNLFIVGDGRLEMLKANQLNAFDEIIQEFRDSPEAKELVSKCAGNLYLNRIAKRALRGANSKVNHLADDRAVELERKAVIDKVLKRVDRIKGFDTNRYGHTSELIKGLNLDEVINNLFSESKTATACELMESKVISSLANKIYNAVHKFYMIVALKEVFDRRYNRWVFPTAEEKVEVVVSPVEEEVVVNPVEGRSKGLVLFSRRRGR